MKLLLLVAASVSFTLGGVCMKYSDGLAKGLPSVFLFLLFTAGAAFQTLGMRNAEMSASYIFVLGLESVLAFVFGVVFFRESASLTRIVAVALVTCGIVLLRR